MRRGKEWNFKIVQVKFLQIAKPIRFHLTDPAMIYGMLLQKEKEKEKKKKGK